MHSVPVSLTSAFTVSLSEVFTVSLSAAFTVSLSEVEDDRKGNRRNIYK